MQGKIILLAFRVAGYLPVLLSQFLGYLLGSLFYLIPNRERRIAQINIDACLPDYSPTQKRKVLRRCLIEIARTFLETPRIWRDFGRLSGKIELGENAELLQQALDKGKGVIITSAHLGNWELGLRYVATQAPTTALYRPLRKVVLEPILKAGRSSAGATLAPATTEGVKLLIKALRRGEVMILLADQQPKAAGAQGGVFAPFFGHPAHTMVLVGRMARKTGATVLFSYLERLPWGRGYRAHFIPAPEAISDSDPIVAATALNQGLEQCIRRCPEQYLWSYKRFGAQPDGTPPFYSSQ